MKTIDQWIKFICNRPESDTKGEKHYSVARSELADIQRDARGDTKLRLFVFESFCPDYTDGLAFAIANNEEDAREQIWLDYGLVVHPHEWGTLKVLPLNKRVAFQVSGGG